MMQAPINRRSPKVHRPKRYEKKEVTPFNEALLKPDPDFIDERKTVEKIDEKGFFSKLLGL